MVLMSAVARSYIVNFNVVLAWREQFREAARDAGAGR